MPNFFKPIFLFIFFYFCLISLGTAFLLFFQKDFISEEISFLDALFTTTSIVTLTGLSLENTATFFTTSGHFFILVLMQISGIAILFFGSYFFILNRKIKNQEVLKIRIGKLFFQICFTVFTIELIGSLCFFMLWNITMPFYDDFRVKVFYSIFHAVSAFCNAGFSLFTNNFNNIYLQKSFVLHLILAGLVVVGGLGFPVLKDLFSIKNLRARMQNPSINWNLSTRIAIFGSFFLILFGMIFFFISENHNSLENQSFSEKIIRSIFQAISCRTAGFNTVEISSLNHFTTVLFIFLMIVGTSSASTGGGIKINNFTLLFKIILQKTKGNPIASNIKKSLLNALKLIFIPLDFIILIAILLFFNEPNLSFLNLFFETVSAFCNVGLSQGITNNLNFGSKILLIICMFVGRVGLPILAFLVFLPSRNLENKIASN